MNTVKQLVQAASKSDLKTLNHILKAEPDLAQDWKPLMDACYSGRAEVVDVLLKHGADPNIKSKSAHNYRPLHRTVEFKKTAPKTEGHLKTVELLLKHGADPMMPGAWYKVSAIAVAAFGGTKQFLPPMLKRAPRQLDLYTATALGRVARIKAILGKNPSLARAPDREPSEKDKGLTALHYCASSSLGQKDAKVAAALAEVAELLIENGA